jgi:Sugar-transfer associated ATP-grasp
MAKGPATTAGYLADTAAAGKFDLPAAMQRLAAQGGPGALAQAIGVMRLLMGGSGASIEEYYTFGLWRPGIGAQMLRELLPNRHFTAFNNALMMPSLGDQTARILDKLATEALLRARGLPCVQTQAAFVPPGAAWPEGADHVTRLVDAASLAAYLSDPAHLPAFGKPRSDSFARGAAVISGLGSAGDLTFLNGRQVPIAALAAEIARDWPVGYLFQPFYQCHPSLQRHVGPAMASVRIVTLLTDQGVEPWYGVLRIPAQKAMHDGDAKGDRIWGLIDLSTGAITRLRNLKDPITPDLTHWGDPTTPLLGMILPHWPAAMQAVIAGHDSFPGHGLLGWDVFLTPEGALLNEVNAQPGHVYQAAAARGLRNLDMEPAYARALAHAKRVNGTA